jgi:hypothetical protein
MTDPEGYRAPDYPPGHVLASLGGGSVNRSAEQPNTQLSQESSTELTVDWVELEANPDGLLSDHDALVVLADPQRVSAVSISLYREGCTDQAYAMTSEKLESATQVILGAEQAAAIAVGGVEKVTEVAGDYLAVVEEAYAELAASMTEHNEELDTAVELLGAARNNISAVVERLTKGEPLDDSEWGRLQDIREFLVGAVSVYAKERKGATKTADAQDAAGQKGAKAIAQCEDDIETASGGIAQEIELRRNQPDPGKYPETLLAVQRRGARTIPEHRDRCQSEVDEALAKLRGFRGAITDVSSRLKGIADQLSEVNEDIERLPDQEQLEVALADVRRALDGMLATRQTFDFSVVAANANTELSVLISRIAAMQRKRGNVLGIVVRDAPDSPAALRRQPLLAGSGEVRGGDSWTASQ